MISTATRRLYPLPRDLDGVIIPEEEPKEAVASDSESIDLESDLTDSGLFVSGDPDDATADLESSGESDD